MTAAERLGPRCPHPGCKLSEGTHRHHPRGREIIAPLHQTMDQLLAEVEALPSVEFTTQDEFLTVLADLLDGALHPDTCSIDADGTYCSCYIARVREALPKCREMRPQEHTSRTEHGLTITDVWVCVRTAHPASPDHHMFAANESGWV